MAFGLFKKKEEKKSQGPKYYNLKVAEVVNETSDAISIRFERTQEPIPYLPGQFLTLIQEIDGKQARRAYSMSSSPFVDEQLQVTVKRVEGGLMSNYLADNLQAGDELKVMEPMGSFTTEYDPDNKRHVIMFAGGSGITPMMSLMKSIITQEEDSIVSLIYCNRNIDSIIFKDELEKWQTNYEGRFHVIHVLDDAPMNWQGMSGLLNHEMLKKLFERIPNWGHEKTTYLMCGPEGMMKNVDSLLELEQIPRENIFKESFVQGTIDKAIVGKEEGKEEASTEGPADVTIHYDGDTFEFTVEPGEFILETALDNGYDLPYSCQSGLCTACRCKKVAGEVKMEEDEGLSESEINDGFVLICVGRPATQKVELEVG